MKINRLAQDGFTLIELLVVISILSVLLSLMLPGLSKAKQQAENLRCSANSRGLAVTMSSYFNDMKGYLPPLCKPNADGTPAPWDYHYGSWYQMIRPWLTLENPTATGTFHSDRAAVAACPSRVDGTYTYGYPYFQYAMPWTLRYRTWGVSTTSWRIDELQDLSNTGMFVDNGYVPDSTSYVTVGLYAQQDYTSAGTLYATKQHNGEGVGQTFLDGHAEFAVLNPASATSLVFPQSAKFAYRTFYGKTGLAPSGTGYLATSSQYLP